MSISSEITRISGNVSDALTAIANKGVTVPSGSNSDDLADLIAQISGGGGSGGGVIVQDEDGYLVLSPNEANAVRVSRTADSHGGDILNIEAVNASGGYTIDDIAEGAPTGAITISANSIATRAFTHRAITDVTAPNATVVGDYAFAYNVNLGTVKMPNLLSLGTSTYSGVFSYAGTTSRNAIIVLPKVNTMYRSIFDRGYFAAVDLGPDLGNLPNDAFYHNTGNQTVVALILRRTAGIVTAATAGAINGLRDVYVPSALISQYEQATNWSTRVSGGYITFHAIEGSQYENYYADGTPIS